MIGELAILPKALREKSYSDPDFARVCLQRLFDCVRNDAVARNVAGRWAQSLSGHANLHPCSKEILEYLVKEGRLVPDGMTSLRPPSSDGEWLSTTLDSHNRSPLNVIVTRGLPATVTELPSVAADISALEQALWWRNRAPSVEVERTLAGYSKVLSQMAKFSRKLEIIDPYLNPEERNYTEFPMLLRKLVEANRDVFLSIHVSESVSGSPQLESFVASLKDVRWTGELELHVWKHFHDRFIVSNLVGISIPKGLETLVSKGGPLLWTRLSEAHRRKIIGTYDPVTQRNRHLESFTWRQGGAH